MKPKEFIKKLKDLKIRRFEKNEYAKSIGEEGGTIDDPVMRIMSLVREGNYDYAVRSQSYSQETWEEFASGISDKDEIVGQYSEDTPNVVCFEFDTESEDTYHVTVFLLSDDDYALVPTTIESEDGEDSTRYLNDWINNATEGEYTAVVDVPTVTSQGYREGYALAAANQYTTNDGVFFTLKDRNFDYILGYNATWQRTIS